MEKQNPHSQEPSLDNLEELSGLNPEAMDLVNTFTSLFGIGAGMRIRQMLLDSPEFLQTLKSKSIDSDSFDSVSDIENEFSDREYVSNDSDLKAMTNVYRLQPLIKEVTADYPLIDSKVLSRLCHVESRGNSDVVNQGSKATGLTQITPIFLDDYCKRENVNANTVDLKDPKTNLEITCSNLSHYLKNQKIRSYLDKHPQRLGFVIYAIHHDGLGGALKSITTFDKFGADITEIEYNSDLHLQANHYLTSKRPYVDFLTVMQLAARVNGNLNNDSQLKRVKELNIKEHTKRIIEKTDIKPKESYEDVEYFGDSVMVGSRLYSDGKNTATAKIGEKTSVIRESAAEVSLEGKNRAVICVGHNDIAALGNLPSGKQKSKRKSYRGKIDTFIQEYIGLISDLEGRGLKVVVMIPHLVQDDNYPKYPGLRSQSRILNLLKSELARSSSSLETIDHSDKVAKLHPTTHYATWRKEMAAALEAIA